MEYIDSTKSAIWVDRNLLGGNPQGDIPFFVYNKIDGYLAAPACDAAGVPVARNMKFNYETRKVSVIGE